MNRTSSWMEQPELGRSAGLRFADPEEAPTSPGPPGRPSVPLTMRRNRTMKSKLSIERVHSWARRVAWRSALRKALCAAGDNLASSQMPLEQRQPVAA